MRNETPAEIADAEGLAERLRDRLAELEQVSWDLDSALSSIEKDAAGYRRSNRANSTGGANSIPGDVREAAAKAGRILEHLTFEF
jgi:hypothetical protein